MSFLEHFPPMKVCGFNLTFPVMRLRRTDNKGTHGEKNYNAWISHYIPDEFGEVRQTVSLIDLVERFPTQR